MIGCGGGNGSQGGIGEGDAFQLRVFPPGVAIFLSMRRLLGMGFTPAFQGLFITLLKNEETEK